MAALSCLSSDGAVTKKAVKTLSELVQAKAPQVAFFVTQRRSASLQSSFGLYNLYDYFFRSSPSPLNDKSGIFSLAGPFVGPSDVNVNVKRDPWRGYTTVPMSEVMSSSSNWPQIQSSLALYKAGSSANISFPCMTLPLAQCWGGAVGGYLEVSFKVEVPPSKTTRINLGIFHGYMGDDGHGGQVVPGYTGSPAFEDSGGLTGVTIQVSGPPYASVLVSSPYQRLVMPIKYSRNAPYTPGAIDNQYVVILWAETHDFYIILNEITVLFSASAATDVISPGWPLAEVPASLNSPLPWGV